MNCHSNCIPGQHLSRLPTVSLVYQSTTAVQTSGRLSSLDKKTRLCCRLDEWKGVELSYCLCLGSM